jgi:hypothetical protein
LNQLVYLYCILDGEIKYILVGRGDQEWRKISTCHLRLELRKQSPHLESRANKKTATYFLAVFAFALGAAAFGATLALVTGFALALTATLALGAGLAAALATTFALAFGFAFGAAFFTTIELPP